jgi:hypothetical protein
MFRLEVCEVKPSKTVNISRFEASPGIALIRDMAFVGMEAALAEPYRKMVGFYMTALLISAARKLVLGKR